MKYLLLLCLVPTTLFASETKFATCELKFTGPDVPEKIIPKDNTMVERACDDLANWIIIQHAPTYNKVTYRHGSSKWKVLKLEDAVEEVAHP